MRIKNSIYVLTFLLGLNFTASAQKSEISVMNISVNVISGSTITDKKNLEIDLNSKNINVGELEIKSSKYIDTQIKSESSFTLTNQYGESIKFNSYNSISENEESRSIKMNALLADSETNLRGQYQGNLKTTIAYF